MPRLIRKVRQRFGISAPRLTVRTQLAWYWRWLGLLVSAAIVLAIAAWMYDAGRRFVPAELTLGAEPRRRGASVRRTSPPWPIWTATRTRTWPCWPTA